MNLLIFHLGIWKTYLDQSIIICDYDFRYNVKDKNKI